MKKSYYADFEKLFEAGRRRSRELFREEPSGEQEPRAAAPPALEQKSLLDEIIGSNRFLSLDEELTEVYASYLTYHVQRDLYELCLERGLFSNLSWEGFIYSMRHCKQARDTAAAVLQETIKGFWAGGCLSFDVADEPMYQDSDLAYSDADGRVICAELLTPDKRHGLVWSIFLKAEIAQYRRRFSQDENCSWKQYLADVLQNKATWDEIILVVRAALRRLDFRTVWQSKDLEKMAGWLNARQESEEEG